MTLDLSHARLPGLEPMRRSGPASWLHDARRMLETFQITKHFGATRALDGIDFSVRPGEIHALVGQNGAGKSTLVKIVSGALSPNAGTVRLDGVPVDIGSPHNALRLGISIVHQHSGLVPSLTVAENMFLGRMPTTKMGLVDWERLRLEATALLARLDFQVDPNRLAESLDAASQQVIEIARALSISARVLILDEPSAVLGNQRAGAPVRHPPQAAGRRQGDCLRLAPPGRGLRNL